MVRPCLLRSRWRPRRPLRRSAMLTAGLGRGRGASSASAAAAAAPRARYRAGSAAALGCAGRAGTACRWLRVRLGRTVPGSHSCQLYTRRCFHTLNTDLRSLRLTLELFCRNRLVVQPNLIQHAPHSLPNCLVRLPRASFNITKSERRSELTIVHDTGHQ